MLICNFQDNSKMDLLAEQLNNYSKNGIPNLATLPVDEDEGESLISRDIPCSPECDLLTFWWLASLLSISS